MLERKSENLKEFLNDMKAAGPKLEEILDHLRIMERRETIPSPATYFKDNSQFMGADRDPLELSSDETEEFEENTMEPNSSEPSKDLGPPLEPIFPEWYNRASRSSEELVPLLKDAPTEKAPSSTSKDLLFGIDRILHAPPPTPALSSPGASADYGQKKATTQKVSPRSGPSGVRGGARGRIALRPKVTTTTGPVTENRAAKLVQQQLELQRPGTIVTTDRKTFRQFDKLAGEDYYQLSVPQFSVKKVHRKWSSTSGSPTSREVIFKVNQARKGPEGQETEELDEEVEDLQNLQDLKVEVHEPWELRSPNQRTMP